MATANKFNLYISPPPDNLKCVICQELTVLIAVLLAKDNFILLSFKECINHALWCIIKYSDLAAL